MKNIKNYYALNIVIFQLIYIKFQLVRINTFYKKSIWIPYLLVFKILNMIRVFKYFEDNFNNFCFKKIIEIF